MGSLGQCVLITLKPVPAWSQGDGRDSGRWYGVGGGFLLLQEQLGGGFCMAGLCLPGLTMAAKKGRKYRSAGRCSQLWEESEMGLQTRIQAGI